MSERVLSLDNVRTDGWFERIGETIGSFQALCDIIGTRFFAFAMITGARITSLTVDRRTPDNTIVEFGIGDDEGGVRPEDLQSVTLSDFRRRLVSALVQDEPDFPAPPDDRDTEALQRHLGIRYLLLAPLFGYSLLRARVVGSETYVELESAGAEEAYALGAFRARLRSHVRQELDRVTRGQGQGAIDLGRVTEAEAAARSGNWGRVAELLGSWPAPLAIFLRTPEGQMLGPEARATVARGLSLLGSACVEFSEYDKAEEILRLAVQYAGEAAGAGDVYLRLGMALMAHGRPGEAIGPLRRAVALEADPAEVWPALGIAFLERGRLLAALATTVAGLQAGAPPEALAHVRSRVIERLGAPYEAWFAQVPDAVELPALTVRMPPPSETSRG
jgi:tetratricopeptide (TPR) repeat protein